MSAAGSSESDAVPTDALTIRAPGPDDAGRLFEIERACFPDPWPAHSFVELCDGSRSDCWVAELGGRVVGYWVGRRVQDEADLANFAVAPESRGKGIGRALLDDFIKTVGGYGRTVIYLEVRESNVAALALYRAFGFEEVGRRKAYYTKPTEDALVMARPAGRKG
ncbi:MAG: ribosomal-protein-alanine N-acetyltransferase [Gemmatimonas sp.]|nr:ribosomal-protein-alanine N-acetyltransferase [Gemmatimonas sp.]